MIRIGDLVTKGFDTGHLVAIQTVRAAKDGNTEAAIDILREFVGAIDQYSEKSWDGPIYWEHAVYIAEAFEKIVRAAMRADRTGMTKWEDFNTGPAEPDANLALGIKSSKAGRRQGVRTHNRDALAAALNLLLVHGIQAKQAKLHLHQETGAAIRTIEIANKENGTYRWYLEKSKVPNASAEDREWAIECIKDGAAPYAQKIERILVARRCSKK